jgi:hypothetical protein
MILILSRRRLYVDYHVYERVFLVISRSLSTAALGLDRYRAVNSSIF